MAALNDELVIYLGVQYIPAVFPFADLGTLIQYDLSQRAGDATTRFQAMLAAAAAFTPAGVRDEAPAAEPDADEESDSP